MTTREVVAANVRARLAWARIPQAQLMARFGWSKRTTHNKLYGTTGLTDDELAGLAALFDLADPGLLFRVPDGFAVSTSAPVWIPVAAGQRHLHLVRWAA